jgi:cytochrome oxidase assembly protein ShyY1
MMQKPEAPASLPATVQTLYWDDWQRSLSTLTGRAVFPFEVRVDQRSPLALVAEWPIVNQSPAKHIGYAIQWFAMAAVLVFIGVWRLTNLGAILTKRASP